MNRSILSRRARGAAVAALGLVIVVGCSSGDPSDQGSPSVRASSQAIAPVLATVDPTVVAGISSTVDENLELGRYTYLTLPVVPGADPWTDAMRAGLAPQLARFSELATPADEPPYPELQVSWDLVAASPEAIGVRSGDLRARRRRHVPGQGPDHLVGPGHRRRPTRRRT